MKTRRPETRSTRMELGSVGWYVATFSGGVGLGVAIALAWWWIKRFRNR